MPREVTVISGLLRFVQEIYVGPHLLQSDEPDEFGGRDAGPDPHELLLAALGTCAGITVQMYADRKQWPVDAVRVQLSYLRNPLEIGTNGSNATQGCIEMDLSFSGDLSDAQRDRLLEIAARCPVHRLLTSPVNIQLKFVPPVTDGSSAI